MKRRKIYIVLMALITVSFLSSQKPLNQHIAPIQTEPIKIDQSVKYNPGHYWMIYKKQRANPQYLRSVCRELDTTPALKGIQVKFTWRELENDQGNYNWSGIDSLLTLMTDHKSQLVILLELKSFHTTNSKYLVPDYLLTNSSYEGGIQPYTAYGSKDQKGDVIKIWNQNVFDRFDALLKQLGDRYNSNPNFEGIGFSESTFQCYPAGSKCVDEKVFFERLMDLNRALKSHFPNSLTYQFVNYPRKYLELQASQLTSMGSGWAGPDVFPTDAGLNGRGKAYWWYGQLSGKIPLLPSVQTEDYLWTTHNKKADPGHKPTITELFEFARDSLKANYIFWERVFVGGESYFKPVLEKLSEPEQKNSPAGGLNAACPSAYKNCNTK